LLQRAKSFVILVGSVGVSVEGKASTWVSMTVAESK